MKQRKIYPKMGDEPPHLSPILSEFNCQSQFKIPKRLECRSLIISRRRRFTYFGSLTVEMIDEGNIVIAAK